MFFLLGDDGGFSYEMFGVLVKALNNTVLYWLRVVWTMHLVLIGVRGLPVYLGGEVAVRFS